MKGKEVCEGWYSDGRSIRLKKFSNKLQSSAAPVKEKKEDMGGGGRRRWLIAEPNHLSRARRRAMAEEKNWLSRRAYHALLEPLSTIPQRTPEESEGHINSIHNADYEPLQ